jgi:hypothetical protein
MVKLQHLRLPSLIVTAYFFSGQSWHASSSFVLYLWLGARRPTAAFGVNWAIVPFERHAGKAGAVNFLRDFVVLFESLAKMIQVGITNVLDGKVVDN